MESKKDRKVYTPGMADVEGVIDHLHDQEKKARRAEWLKQYYSKKEQRPQPTKEASDEN